MFNPAAIREFTPQNYDVGNAVSSVRLAGEEHLLTTPQNANGVAQENGLYNDPFTTMSSLGAGLPSAGQINFYASDHNALATSGTQFYAQHGAYPGGPLQPPNYHLYQPFDSYRQDLQPWQRATYDFFMPAKTREELQKKMFATQQVMPSECGLALVPGRGAKSARFWPSSARTVALAVSPGYQQQEEHFIFWLPELGIQGAE